VNILYKLFRLDKSAFDYFHYYSKPCSGIFLLKKARIPYSAHKAIA